MIQSYRQKKNIFTDLSKIPRLARSFTNLSDIPKNYNPLAEDGFKLVDYFTVAHSSFMLYPPLKCDFLANFTNKEKMNCHCWSLISPFRCQAGRLLILKEFYLYLILKWPSVSGTGFPNH